MSGNLMHQNVVTAGQTDTTAQDVVAQLIQLAEGLREHTNGVIPAAWNMVQASAFSNGEERFYEGAMMLSRVMSRIGANTLLAANLNTQVDESESQVIGQQVQPSVPVETLTKYV